MIDMNIQTRGMGSRLNNIRSMRCMPIELNNIRSMRCMSIEKEMYVFFVRRTLNIKALRAICEEDDDFFIDRNALRAS